MVIVIVLCTGLGFGTKEKHYSAEQHEQFLDLKSNYNDEL